MEVRAKARYLHLSPRKLRLIVGLVASLNIAAARDQLQNLPKKGAIFVLKLLNSAVANASHNHKLKEGGLIIKSIFVDEGPTVKRWRPRAFGRAGQIRKRTSHLTIILEERKAKEKVESKKNNKKMSNDKVQSSNK